MDEIVVHLNPSVMKGPNAKLPFVEEMPSLIRLEEWRNVALPLKDAFRILMRAFVEVKSLYFQNFNSIMQTQRVVNMIQ